MLLVVAYHVAQMCFVQNEKTSASLPFLVLFRMPLFFFVSGFLSYKASFAWTAEAVGRQLWRKFLVQVFPALIFLSVYIIFRINGDFWHHFTRLMSYPTKGGYWFTWVLLQMYLIYYLYVSFVRTLVSTSRKPLLLENISLWVLFFLSVFVYATMYMPKVFTYHKAHFFQYSSLIETMKFMQFFVLGNLLHRYWPVVQRLFNSAWFFPLLVLVAFFSCADIFRWHTMKHMWTNLPRTLAMYSLLMIVIICFFHYAASFTREHVIGRSLQYIGVRTLDIYLLHFILMPRVPEIGKWLNAHQPNFLLDILLAFSFALPVIAMCCLVSHVLRVSPFFSKYLFGR